MHKEKDGTETHLGKIEARAGSRNKVNRNALVAGLLLVLVAFAVILGFGFLNTADTGADRLSADNVAVNEGAR
ncbi:MAG: hypothetical protein QM690_12970 [Sphingobium sp.]